MIVSIDKRVKCSFTPHYKNDRGRLVVEIPAEREYLDLILEALPKLVRLSPRWFPKQQIDTDVAEADRAV